MSICCTICQDMVTERPQTLDANEELVIMAMTCGHVFHRSCIREWFHKLGQQTENGPCPCCKTTVFIGQGLRLFPSGDEESQAMAEKISQAKEQISELKHSRAEIDQLNMILEDLGCQLEDEKVQHEISRFEHSVKLSEVDELKRQSEEQAKLYESQESNWNEIVEKIDRGKQEAVLQLEEMQKQLVNERQEREEAYEKEILDLKRKLETESADKNIVKMREIEQTHLTELQHYENLLKREPMVDASCQTDGRDAALLQARLVSYKSCLLHMQSEVRLLESEYDKLKQLQPVDESFGSLMNDALNKSIDVILDGSSPFNDEVDNCSINDENDEKMVISTGEGDFKHWDENHSSSGNTSLGTNANEEYSDAPLWAVDDQ